MSRTTSLPAAALLMTLLAACGEKQASDGAPLPAPGPFAPEVSALIDQYEATAGELSQLLARSPVDGEHAPLTEKLMVLAEGITPAFVARHPSCKAYLEAALGVKALWPSLDAETLERDYHDDGALPAEGTTPACYHMKDLIVHPASAAALMKQTPPDPAAAKREIDEVLAHVGVVRGG
jgi:hypothetical protein